jgi:hypothetical protein
MKTIPIDSPKGRAMEKINKGIFGFGLSENGYLELLTIVFLAYAGIIIKLCFSES